MTDSHRPAQLHDLPRSMGGTIAWTDTERTRARFHGNVEALKRDLRQHLRGEVRFDTQSQALYSTDASNYRQIPLGVVLPKDKEDLIRAVAACRKHGAPITHRGGGTSLAGQTTNACVVIDSSKYLRRIVEIDPEKKRARVEPGVRRDELANLTEREHNLTFGPNTSTHQWATLGGMIGNNSCGMHSEFAGKTVDNVEELEVLLYDGTRLRVGPTSDEELEGIIAEGGRRGEIYRRLRNLRDTYAGLIRERYPDIPRRISGYNLDELLPENGFNAARALVGTEGTCVTILEATLRLVYLPPERVLVVLGFEDIAAAGHHVMEVKQFEPLALEGLDDVLLEDMKLKNLHPQDRELLPEGGGWLYAEFGGETQEEAREKAQQLIDSFSKNSKATSAQLFADAEEQQHLWTLRESGLGATARVPNDPDTWPGWEDSACPPEKLGDYLTELRALYEKYDYEAALYGHFGQGVVHTRIPFDLYTAPGIEKYRRFMDEASDLCMRYGGSLSAEHGDGQARAELLPKMFGAELMEAFRTFKEIWDPDWKMNPGKVVDPFRMDENLRLGANYRPPDLKTHFAFPEDDGSLHRAVTRCVGVGKCRRLDLAEGEVMCPSFIATEEEKHTTRGRARLLFEMLRGAETPEAWDNEDVKDALDLCLSCKGCKNDCPVNVDMATYKAEFLSHYYEHHARPRHAYAFGLIYWWARLASRMPDVVNFFAQAPGLRTVTKKIAGIAPQRQMPRLPPQTFRDWFGRRRGRNPEGPKVMLWPDTFNNFFKPDTAKAAVEVLEDAGYQVMLPRRVLCCGRPLYDYGWIEQGKRLWRQTLDALRDDIRAGTPIVGLEPSCTAAFRDELLNLFPNDWDARRLSRQVYTLGEFLDQKVEGYQPPKLSRKALMHGHCHHKSIMGTTHEQKLLKEMGLDLEVPTTGCCGMAGAFGFEKEHYDISIKVGEHALLPAVRDAARDTLLIADGFSCREQIRQTTDRQALHLAEVLHLAKYRNGAAQDNPEAPYVEALRYGASGVNSHLRKTKWLAAGAFAAGAFMWMLRRR